MNEFIVWDVQEVEFIENECLCIDENGKVRSSNGVLLDEDSYKPFFYIGLTDIDGKKIYADCSIVEFIHDDDSCRCNKACCDCECEPVLTKKVGFFRFNSHTLRYSIHLLNLEEKYDFLIVGTVKSKKVIGFDVVDMNNFKIIDTIQENKLGLIK